MPRALTLLPILVVLAELAGAGPRELRLTPPEVVWIPGGDATLGASRADIEAGMRLCADEHDLTVSGCTTERFELERARHRTHVGAFGIDRTEVTNAAYRRCVAASSCSPSHIPDADARFALDAHPVVGVTHADAARYCAWAGGRLPTELEWEVAARGRGHPRRFPWGTLYNSAMANHGRIPFRADPVDGFRFTAPVGAIPEGASPYGLLDVAGNVWEWTASEPDARDLLREDGTPRFEHFGVAPEIVRVIRGGSWSSPAFTLRVTWRSLALLGEPTSDLGFRCAYDRGAGD